MMKVRDGSLNPLGCRRLFSNPAEVEKGIESLYN
jgi:hypothetical protein